MHTLVLAIGNTLLSDEGIGIHVLDYLRAHHPPPAGVEYLDGGTLSFTLAASIEEADNLIVVDAARLGAAPGSVKQFVDAEMDHFLGTSKRSVHEVGLIDLLTAARLTERLPTRRALVGVEPEKLDWGENPTDRVAQAIPRAAAMVAALISAWHQPYIKHS
jgi:hydrogenase maturation protease